MSEELLTFSEAGIYCPPAGIYIDPWKAVDKAIITHGHSDHARWGSKSYLCQEDSREVLLHRLGAEINLQTLHYGEPITINGVKFSFHPAGHIPGSAQVRVEFKGEVWVASGDYKTEDDGWIPPFEPVPCHAFITESTFGLPVYKWKPQAEIKAEINQWWRENQELGKVTVLTGYSLGKAQRLLHLLEPDIGPIYAHGAIFLMNEVLTRQGFILPEVKRVLPEMKKEEFKGALVMAPPSVLSSSWLKRFQPYSTGIASGWMGLRGTRRRRSVDRGFVLSDHADWSGLNLAVKETGAEKVFVTHGYTDIFSRWLKEQGLDARPVITRFEGELGEINESRQETKPEQEAS